jgi:hypothetical protein
MPINAEIHSKSTKELPSADGCAHNVVSPRRISKLVFDLLFGAAVALGIVLSWLLVQTDFLKVFVRTGKFGLPPFEDAAMLFRYAQNMASGAGIVWNTGEAPGVSDGATDLGFVLAIASLVKVGVSAVTAATLINLGAVAATGAAFAVLNRLAWGLRSGPLAAVIAIVMSGPVSHYVAAGFSPPVFGFLLLAASSLMYLAMVRAGHAWALGMSAGAIAGLAGWWRPEGFALAPMAVILASMAAISAGPISRAWPVVRRAALGALAAFLPLGGLWLWFRVAYFGNVLPTSAVMKGHGFHPANASGSALFYGLALLPLVVLLMMGRRGRTLPRGWWVVFVALTIMSSVWVLLDTAMNWWSRMQWPLFPVLAFLAITLVTRGGPLPHPRWNANEVFAMFSAVVICVVYFHMTTNGYFPAPFQTAVSTALASEDTSHVRLATTEAGLIPLALDSGGLALDTVGLNERSIAASGGDKLGDRLRELKPNVIVVHGFRPPNSLNQEDCPSLGDVRWGAMVDKLYAYADSNGLKTLRSTEATRCDIWSVFVGADLSPSVRSALEHYSFQGRELVARNEGLADDQHAQFRGGLRL